MLKWPGRYPRPAQRRRSPVRILRCPALGDEPGRSLCAERTPALGGRAVRAAAAAGPLPPQTRRFFIGGQQTKSQPRPSRPHENAAPAQLPRHTSFALSWSGGKDSALALWTLRREQLAPEAL